MVTGRVLDPSARTLPGVEVRYEGEFSPAATSVTDDEGRFSIAAPSRSNTGSFFLHHAGLAPLFLERALPSDLPEVDLGDLILQHGGALSGSFVDPNGVPVARARLRLEPRRGSRVAKSRFRESMLPEARTDATGRFRFAALAPGPYRIEARAEGFARRWSEFFWIEAGEETELDPLRMEMGHELRGLVVDPEGRALAGALVELHSRERVERTRTDVEGHFHVAHLGAELLRVRAQARGFSEHVLGEVDPSQPTPLLLQLSRAETSTTESSYAPGSAARTDAALLKGTVRGLESSTEVEAHVLAARWNGVPGGNGENGVNERVKSARVDAAGRYVLSGLAPGAYRVRAYAGPLRSLVTVLARDVGEADVQLAAREERRLDLELSPTGLGSLLGKVVRNAAPGAGLWVELRSLEGAGEGAGRTGFADQVRSDHAGAYRFPAVPPGLYELLLRSGDGGRLELHRSEVTLDAEETLVHDLDVSTALLRVSFEDPAATEAQPPRDGRLQLFARAATRPAADATPTYTVSVRAGRTTEIELASGPYFAVLRVGASLITEQAVFLEQGRNRLILEAGD